MKNPQPPLRQTRLDYVVALAVLAFGAAVSLFALRNNDIWWLLATGRYILETKAFIYEDPFTFTLAGHPWSPQAYLSAIAFYLVHGGAGAVGLIALRAVLVVATLAVSLRTLARVGVSWAMSGVVVVLVVLVAQTRFMVRAHLFEYLFVAVTMGFLLTSHERKGRSFFVIPAVVQVLWTNMHPSFLLGPSLVGLYFAGEWLGQRAPVPGLRPFHRRDWRRVGILLAVVVAACVVNPNPAAFFSQPMGGEQRELISRYTLEWKSPFDPAIAAGNFHPYYEILLGLSAAALLLSLGRLQPAALFLILATAYLSLQSHRFRVEFALVALPLVCVLLRDAPLVASLSARLGRKRHGSWARIGLAAAAFALIALTARGRVEVGEAVQDRYPDRALEFISENRIAQRPFHTIGFGSFMVWDLYGQRKTFIDGRNFDAGLYRDFLAAQTNRAGLEHVIDKYRLDAFIVPAVESSDAGMTHIHRELARMPGWSLVYMDEVASVYAGAASADSSWMDRRAYRHYHPLTLSVEMLTAQDGPRIVRELERAVGEAPAYATLWLDLGLAQIALGNHARAVEALEEATRLAPENAVAWNRLGNAALLAGRFDEAIDAFRRLSGVVPGDARPHLYLARACQQASRKPEAILAYENAIGTDPRSVEAHVGLYRLYAEDRHWDTALTTAEEMARLIPESHAGLYYAAEALSAMGRTAEAIDRGNAALRVNPRAANVHMFLALRYAENGEYRRALERVESVLTLEPENKDALAMRTRMRKALGR
jgi:tetratricopeptide (TPR) repeat protein